jgi:mercuric reductase
MELLEPNPDADLRVYSIWFNMYPGDHKSRWNPDLLTDPRVTHYWDKDKLIGRWMVEQKVVDYPRRTLWDSYLLFGPEAAWEETPAPLVGWGMPVYHRRHKLKAEIAPLLDLAEAKGESVRPGTIKELDLIAPSDESQSELYDLMVIGGGGAGFAAAIKGAELGKRVAIVESGQLGGVCVNVGCVPSKTLLSAAAIHNLGSHNSFEEAVKIETTLDWSALMTAKNKLVAKMQKSRYQDVLEAYQEISLLRGRAKLAGGNTVEVKFNESSEVNQYSPDKVIIATGSHAWAPPIKGLAESGYLDSTAALELEQQPGSMIVIGASSVGLEIAQAFSRLGTQVTVLEIQETILPQEDSEISGEMIDILREEGMTIETDVLIREISKDQGLYQVSGSRLGEDREYAAEVLLMATGRRPNTADLGLKEGGVELGANGEIIVDGHLQSSNPHVYAAGDVTGGAMYVYVAAYGGKLAASNALGEDGQIFDVDVLPRVTFTDPGVAAVGLTEEQAYDSGHEVKVSSLPLEFVSRAQTNGNTRGLIKLVADKTTDQLLGAHILAAEAGEVIQTASIALRSGMTIRDLQDMLFPYLTMVEGLKLAALSFDKDPAMLSCCAG